MSSCVRPGCQDGADDAVAIPWASRTVLGARNYRRGRDPRNRRPKGRSAARELACLSSILRIFFSNRTGGPAPGSSLTCLLVASLCEGSRVGNPGAIARERPSGSEPPIVQHPSTVPLHGGLAVQWGSMTRRSGRSCSRCSSSALLLKSVISLFVMRTVGYANAEVANTDARPIGASQLLGTQLGIPPGAPDRPHRQCVQRRGRSLAAGLPAGGAVRRRGRRRPWCMLLLGADRILEIGAGCADHRSVRSPASAVHIPGPAARKTGWPRADPDHQGARESADGHSGQSEAAQGDGRAAGVRGSSSTGGCIGCAAPCGSQVTNREALRNGQDALLAHLSGDLAAYLAISVILDSTLEQMVVVGVILSADR